MGSTKLLGNFDHEHYVKKHWDKVCMENQHIITPKECIQGWGYLYRILDFINTTGVEVLDPDITYKIEPEGRRHGLMGTLDPIIKKDDFQKLNELYDYAFGNGINELFDEVINNEEVENKNEDDKSRKYP